MKVLMVGGTFDYSGGHTSSVFRKLYTSLLRTLEQRGRIGNDDPVLIYNGGNVRDLPGIMKHTVDAHLVLWMPLMPNEIEKTLSDIKKYNKGCLLVSSKVNNGRYKHEDLIMRMLNSKSNLMIEINSEEGTVAMRVLDPLGNIFGSATYTSNINLVAEFLGHRIDQLMSFTRLESVRHGDMSLPLEPVPGYLDLVHAVARQFSQLIPRAPEAGDRMLGNTSFRCTKGFPSYRDSGGRVYVSRRNVNKEQISMEDFVMADMSHAIKYWGHHKPSVDTPIQLRLYKVYPKINFMLHGHVYVVGAPFTLTPIPCGSYEESLEIAKVIDASDSRPNDEVTAAVVNLIGHGFIAMGATLDDLKNLEFRARMLPEIF